MEIYLNPFDILELSKTLNLKTGDVIEEHLLFLENKEQGLSKPVLKAARIGVCSFNVDQKCSIHANRPLSCRLFPVARINDQFVLQQTDYCRGIHEKREENLKSYLNREEATPYLNNSQKSYRLLQEILDTFDLKNVDPYYLKLFNVLFYDYDTAFGEEYNYSTSEEKLMLSLHLAKWLAETTFLGTAFSKEKVIEMLYEEGDHYCAKSS